ncbi:thaumatin-like protein [Silene latifolia]|uniref:thaumatin-like protein n=1 Tax=Silene latifolia TaxID=37657 RepID=UPI003D77B73D
MSSVLHFLILFCFFCFSLTDGVQLMVTNNCNYTVWPGILATAGQETPLGGGFVLKSGQRRVLRVSQNWSGRIWARQGCTFDHPTGLGACQTGDCGGLLQCKGLGGKPPATLVEMTFGTPTSPQHYYDVSLVDGFNLPISMIPLGGRQDDGDGCGVAACEMNLNVCCPSSLEVKEKGMVVGCKSPCLATGLPKYCCTGDYVGEKCQPTVFGKLFKMVCPRAYSHPYDEATGLKTCTAPRYVITFCPST